MDKKKKNILLIACNGLGNSGVPRVICSTIDAAISSYNFDIVVFNKDDYFYPKLKAQGVNIIKIDEPKRLNIFQKFSWRLYKKNCFYRKKFKNIFSKKKYLVVHSFREDESAPIFKAAKKQGISKRIWHQNTITSASKCYLRLLKKLNSKITKKYTTDFVGVSELTCKKTFPEKQYKIIYNGFDELKYNKKIPNLLPEGELNITQIATFSSNKNQLFSIKLLKELLSLCPNTTLILVGNENEDGYLNLIKDKVAELNIENNVKIYSGNADIAKIYSFTTFTILPSLSEGAPLVTIESQATGIRSFVSDAIPSEMDCGGLVFLKLSDGPKKWAERIMNEFQKSGNTRTYYNVERFSNETFAKSIIDLYQDKTNV